MLATQTTTTGQMKHARGADSTKLSKLECALSLKGLALLCASHRGEITLAGCVPRLRQRQSFLRMLLLQAVAAPQPHAVKHSTKNVRLTDSSDGDAARSEASTQVRTQCALVEIRQVIPAHTHTHTHTHAHTGSLPRHKEITACSRRCSNAIAGVAAQSGTRRGEAFVRRHTATHRASIA